MAVHTGKLSSWIFQELRDRGLARPRQGPGWDLWWDVEESTASLYLAYLAGAICGAREGVFPVTDTSRALAALGSPARDPATRLRELRYVAVMQALPAPAHLGLAVGSGLASAGGAAYELAGTVRSPRFDRRAPLVYAALAHEL